jgi:hypothetical protein
MRHSAIVPKLRWWFSLALGFSFLLLRGPQRSFFSGLPLSSRGTALFVAAVILAVFSMLYPPTRLVRLRWIAALALLIALKLALSTLLIDNAWRGEYWTPRVLTQPESALRKALFITADGVESYRIDASPELHGQLTNLTFLNDWAPRAPVIAMGPRDVVLPLQVRWSGWPQADSLDVTITANGHVRAFAGQRLLLDAVDPSLVRLHLPQANTGVRIEYDKPANVPPDITVAGITARVTAQPATPEQVTRSDRAATAIALLGLAMLAVLAFVLFDAYPRMSELLLDHIWQEPLKVAALLFFAFFLAAGLKVSIPTRRLVLQMGIGDDPWAYEGQARTVARYGLAMMEPGTPGAAYYFYPFYSYALAGVHRLFGDDTANIVLFNYFCMASLGLLVWALLHQRVSTGAGLVTMLATAWFERTFMLGYADSAFTDNLFVPLTLLIVLCSAAALHRRSGWMFFLTGVVTALAAATRPSALLFVPCFGLWLLIERGGGSLPRRIGSAAAFGFGFAAGVSPFTIRNWIVSRKFVLLIASFIMLSYFLYPPELGAPNLSVNSPEGKGVAPSLTQSIYQFIDCWRQFPGRTLWTEMRKVLFTFGFTSFGPAGGPGGISYLFIGFPILFGIALWSGRIPRQLRNALLVFGASHLIALVIAAPWTYGYKTIAPLHLLFLIGSAFLLPNWGEQREIQTPSAPLRAPRRQRAVSVILPTYNEKDSIRAVIDGFFDTGLVDEVLVINNNAVEGTSEAVAGSGATEIFEPRQGYGAAIRRGLAEARHECIVVCEPDGTFLPRDIEKLLAYSEDFDAVYGSRTSQQLVWRGANMGTFLRWGNWFVAKYLEFLYNATSLTDVGCTMRLVRRDTARELYGRFRIDGNQFGPEMMIETLRAGCRVIQVPVNYMPRVGVSAVTGDPRKAFILGLEMIWLITRRRFEDLIANPATRPVRTTGAAPS